jgi:hypothetical protein
MTKDEATAKAKKAAEQEGWPWKEPVHAKHERSFIIFGQVYWRIMTNANFRGQNANILIDDRSGNVIKKAFASR